MDYGAMYRFDEQAPKPRTMRNQIECRISSRDDDGDKTDEGVCEADDDDSGGEGGGKGMGGWEGEGEVGRRMGVGRRRDFL